MNYPQILYIPQKLLSIDFRLVYWELFHTLNHNRVKLHGIEQFPHLGSLTLPMLSNYGKPETPWSSAWLAVYADQRRRKVTFDQFLWPIYHYANCCKHQIVHRTFRKANYVGMFIAWLSMFWDRTGSLITSWDIMETHVWQRECCRECGVVFFVEEPE